MESIVTNGMLSNCLIGRTLVWGLVVGYAGLAGLAILWDAVFNRALSDEAE